MHIADVMPCSDVRQVVTQQQLADTIEALRAAGGTKVFLADWIVPGELLAALAAAGFRPARSLPAAGLETLVDTRPPRA